MSIYTGVLERAASSAALASAGLFAGLSGLRNKRFFHPDGVTCEGRVTFRPTDHALPFTGDATAHIRLSRGAGLPGSLPDVFGLAVKLPELNHDFLLATSGEGRITRHMLLPATGFFALPYSSVLPYELNGSLIAFGARSDGGLEDVNPSSLDDLGPLLATGKLRFDLTVAAVGSSRTETFASLVLDRDHSGELEFNPWNCLAPLRPAGPLNRLRLETYKASQAARPDDST